MVDIPFGTGEVGTAMSMSRHPSLCGPFSIYAQHNQWRRIARLFGESLATLLSTTMKDKKTDITM